MWEIRQGDALALLRAMPEASVQTVVTSPPYWGLRDYGVAGQYGLEATPDLYVARMVETFAELRRVLRKDGTLWLNLGDSYAGSRGGPKIHGLSATQIEAAPKGTHTGSWVSGHPTLKPKDLIGIPWRVALALQADGWWLRSDIVWSKPNPMPESITDRPTKAHEYVFLMAAEERYFYDADAVREPVSEEIASKPYKGAFKTDRPDVGGTGRSNDRRGAARKAEALRGTHGTVGHDGNGMRMPDKWNNPLGRNRRTVWTVATEAFPEAHFATMPQEIVEPCVLAGSRPGDLVLDPFCGSGTVGVVSLRHGRRFLGLELNPSYVEMARRRIAGPLFANAEPQEDRK